ncbi:hypothetical protein B0G57_12750 [Trinickia symbiotica]|nr:hypothetical protein B0G57_12750 [Trinickia symbiotica]
MFGTASLPFSIDTVHREQHVRPDTMVLPQVGKSWPGPIYQPDPEFSQQVLNRTYRIIGARLASEHMHYQPIMQFGIGQDADDLLLAFRRSDRCYIESEQSRAGALEYIIARRQQRQLFSIKLSTLPAAA